MFCFKCGQPVNPGQACPACGAVQPAGAAQTPPPNYPPPGYAPPPGQYGQPTYPPATPSLLGSELGKMFKGFFSGNPMGAFEQATQSRSAAGILFLGIAAVFALLAAFSITIFHPAVNDKVFGSQYKIEAFDVVKSCLLFILVPLFAFLLPAIYNAASKSRMPATGVLAVSGLSTLLFSILAFVSFIFGFFWMEGAVMTLCLALCVLFITGIAAVYHLGLARGVSGWLTILIPSVALFVLVLLISYFNSAIHVDMYNYYKRLTSGSNYW